ncbi:uncharacterized protein [Littorina saxatilis]|uniref:uncharacterized protein isoform X2 n=1 Tax=Littorina saxatilis TaxID=31220 RepID=UPI0038B481D2
MKSPTRANMLVTTPHLLPDQSQPGLSMTAPSVVQQGGSEKYATGEKTNNILGNDSIDVATWNMRSVRQDEELKKLVHEMESFPWHVIGLCDMKWKNFGEVEVDKGHKLYYSGNDQIYGNGVGFLVNNNIKNSVLGCNPISSSIITIRLRAKPSNITVIQVYAPTSDYDDEYIEEFYTKLQVVTNKVNKKDILIIQGDWNTEVDVNALTGWIHTCSPSYNAESNERGLHLVEYASYNSLVCANALGQQEASDVDTQHAPRDQNHKTDYILVQNRYKSEVNSAMTAFPRADVNSEHNLVKMNLRVQLRKFKKAKNCQLKFDLERLNHPAIPDKFQARIGGKFAPLLLLADDWGGKAPTSNCLSMTETAREEVLERSGRKSEQRVTKQTLDLHYKKRAMKKDRKTSEELTNYLLEDPTRLQDKKTMKTQGIKHLKTDISGGVAAKSYPMTRRGFCLIINNRDFKDLGQSHGSWTRDGTDIDRDKLKKTFRKQGFTVLVRENYTDTQMTEIINKVAHKDHSNYDCLVCFILTHGIRGAVYGINWKHVPLMELISPFLAQKCPSLAGKPKLFFLQACQGNGTQGDDHAPEHDLTSCPPSSPPHLPVTSQLSVSNLGSEEHEAMTSVTFWNMCTRRFTKRIPGLRGNSASNHQLTYIPYYR